MADLTFRELSEEWLIVFHNRIASFRRELAGWIRFRNGKEKNFKVFSGKTFRLSDKGLLSSSHAKNGVLPL